MLCFYTSDLRIQRELKPHVIGVKWVGANSNMNVEPFSVTDCNEVDITGQQYTDHAATTKNKSRLNSCIYYQTTYT